MKKIIILICVCSIMMIYFSCAGSEGARGLAVEELPGEFIQADVAVYPQLGHTGYVNTVAFSPDGKTFFSGSNDGTVKLWDIESGRELRAFYGHAEYVRSVALSPDGKTLISGSQDRMIKLWDTEAGKEILSLPGHSFIFSLSPDGKILAAGSDNNLIKLFDITGKELREFSGHTGPISSLTFSSNGNILASGSHDNTIKLWDMQTGRNLMTLYGHSDAVTGLKFYSNDSMLISGSNDNTIKIWETATGDHFSFSVGPYCIVSSVEYFSDEKAFGALSREGNTVKLMNIATGRAIRTFTGDISGILDAAFSPGYDFVIAAGNKKLMLWDLDTEKEIKSFYGNTSYIESVAFSSDGRYIASGSNDKKAILWDASSGSIVRVFAGETERINLIAYSPKGEIIATTGSSTAGSSNRITFWNTATGQALRTFGGNSNNVSSIAFSPDGLLFVSGSWTKSGSGEIIIWETATGQALRKIEGHQGLVTTLKFNSKSNAIFSSAGDGKIKMWDANTGREMMELPGHGALTLSLAVSPDGRRIVSSAYDATIKLWDLSAGREIQTIKGHANWVNSVAFSPNGKIFASASDDNLIKLWDTGTGREIRTITGHLNSIYAVAFHPNGRQLVSSSLDGTVRLWDISTGREIASLIAFTGNDTALTSASRGLSVEFETAAANADGEWLSITPDGYYNASPRGDRYVNVRINDNVTSIDSYRSVFYNPDVVKARIAGKRDPASKRNISIQQAAAFKPPEIAIKSPEDGSSTNSPSVNLSVAITGRSQPVRNIKILVNGRLIGREEFSGINGTGLEIERASLTVTGNQNQVEFDLPLELDPGPNRIEVIAFNGYSESRRYIDLTSPDYLISEKLSSQANLWILAVGVNHYENAGTKLGGMGSLNFSVADAKGLIDSLKAQEGRRYGKVNSLLIADGENIIPTLENIRKNFAFLEGANPRRDVVILFLAGHGISDQEGKFFFLPRDAAINQNKTVNVNTALSGDEILAVLESPGNRLVFIDACHSGGVDSDRMIRSLMDTNAFVLSASKGNELSYEDPSLGHGFFTYSVISAIKGTPEALVQGKVSVLSLKGFVVLDVARRSNNRQNPSAYSLGFYDFPVALFE